MNSQSPSDKKYQIGMNCADETAGQVANYLLADLRVFLRDVPAASELVDRLYSGIDAALRESATRAQSQALTQPVQPVPEWIPVGERLPSSHQSVLLLGEDGRTRIGWMDTGKLWTNACGNATCTLPITHWQPLPSPPNNSVQTTTEGGGKTPSP